ncbi:hypothetical protein J6590_105373, partial [Homalodisca vitripennis]
FHTVSVTKGLCGALTNGSHLTAIEFGHFPHAFVGSPPLPFCENTSLSNIYSIRVSYTPLNFDQTH